MLKSYIWATKVKVEMCFCKAERDFNADHSKWSSRDLTVFWVFFFFLILVFDLNNVWAASNTYFRSLSKMTIVKVLVNVFVCLHAWVHVSNSRWSLKIFFPVGIAPRALWSFQLVDLSYIVIWSSLCMCPLVKCVTAEVQKQCTDNLSEGKSRRILVQVFLDET